MSASAPVTKRGFQLMDPQRQREIARMGGKSAHQTGKAHQFTTDEAKAAGRKGGASVARDRAYMAALGRKGGKASAAARADRAVVFVGAKL